MKDALNVYKNIFFSPDDSAGGGDTTATEESTTDVETTSADDGKKHWTPEMQAEFDKRAAALKKAAKEAGRADALAELEKKSKKEKEDAEKKRLAEEGKYQEVATKAEAARLEAENRAIEAERKAHETEKKVAYRDAVDNLNIEFANDQARKDAFLFLDDEEVGDDFSGMEKAVQKIVKERPYLVGKRTDDEATDAKEKGRKPKEDKEAEQSLISRFNIRKPR